MLLVSFVLVLNERERFERVVVWQLARRRQGTQKTKGRSEVRGSTKKMGPQKVAS